MSRPLSLSVAWELDSIFAASTRRVKFVLKAHMKHARARRRRLDEVESPTLTVRDAGGVTSRALGPEPAKVPDRNPLSW